MAKSIAALKRKIITIEQEGYLSNCWIARYTPGGSAKGEHSYYQLRSRVPFANGKRTQHIPLEALPHFVKLVNNGRLLPNLRQQVAQLEAQPYTALNMLTSSISDEWYTPPEYIALAREVMGGIDLDPASNDLAQQWIQARQYFTFDDDGLAMRWTGRVWLNPPYGKYIRRWTDKAVSEFQNGFVSQLILLVRPAIASSWYQALTAAFVKCEPNQRIRFINRDGVPRKSPVHGNTFFYIGREVEQFHSVFSRIGTVSMPYVPLVRVA